jgi:hypothetical protein
MDVKPTCHSERSLKWLALKRCHCERSDCLAKRGSRGAKPPASISGSRIQTLFLALPSNGMAAPLVILSAAKNPRPPFPRGESTPFTGHRAHRRGRGPPVILTERSDGGQQSPHSSASCPQTSPSSSRKRPFFQGHNPRSHRRRLQQWPTPTYDKLQPCPRNL